jgi:hypothetical protein
MHRVGAGRRRPAATGMRYPRMASVAALLKGPADGARGSPWSPQGAEFRHGPAATRAGTVAGAAEEGRGFAASGPQQQDSFLHLLAHLQ